MFVTRVLRRRTPCVDHFELTLETANFPAASPGQFLQVLCRAPRNGDGLAVSHEQGKAGDSCSSSGEAGALRSPSGKAGALPSQEARWFGERHGGALLRRPFSIAALRRTQNGCEIDLLGRVTGEGTAWLASRQPGDDIDVVGPLGRGFSWPAAGSRALLVAGGIGLPPIRWLGEELSKRGIACDAVYGAVTRDSLPVRLLSEPPTDGASAASVEEFARHGISTILTTDDGSCGMRGRVTDGMRRYCESIEHAQSVQVYACGGEEMLRAIAVFCADRGMPCEVAMERKMACGMGTCQSCVVPVIDQGSELGWRYALCCTEGPVFNAASVFWPRAAG